MSEHPSAEPTDPQDFLPDLEQPRFEMVDKAGKQEALETRDPRPAEHK